MRAGIRARLFDANGQDRTVDPGDLDLADIGSDQLAWVDIDLDTGGRVDVVADALQLTDRDRRRIEADVTGARVVQGVDRLHLTLEELVPEEDDRPGALERREIDLLAGKNLVVSVHRGPAPSIERFAEGLARDSSLGVLDAGDLLSGLVDEVINGYYILAEQIEVEIDHLDQAALRGERADILASIVALRKRVGTIRRVLVPHRAAFAALARPEIQAEQVVGRPWPGLVDRVEGAIASYESLRSALLGTYDIHMGRVAQRANDVMKVLTLLSAVFLPAVVLAGIMGMNFKLAFFETPENFFIVVAVMAAFAMLLLGVARWRRWL